TSSLGLRALTSREGKRTHTFSIVIGPGKKIDGAKPHRDIYLRIAEKLGIPAGACLVIEDAVSGVLAAKAARMRVAAIPDTRFVDPHDYEKEADYVLGSLLEIPALIRGLAPAA